MTTKKSADWANAPGSNDEWEDITSDFVKFENAGDSLEGFLIEKGTQEMRNGTVGRYKIETYPEGEVKSFHGSRDLDDKLGMVDVNSYVRITFKDTTATRNGAMKNFAVQVRTKNVPTPA